MAEDKNQHNQPIDWKLREKDWVEEIKNSEAIQHYFKGFLPSSVEDFIKHYVHEKYMWHNYSDLYKDSIDNENLQWVESARHHLQFILQKKLFDAQCLWRAEKVKFEGVELCADFQVWENDIFNCPFIDPITERDIDLYAAYLQQNNVDLTDDGSWQDHEEIKEAYNSNNGNRNFPEWYDFHNGRTGNGVLMTLPDVRGEKEEFYCDLHHAQQREANKEEDENWEKNRDKRPWIRYYEKDTMNWFVTTFENKDIQTLYKDYTFANRHRDEEIDWMQIIKELLHADEHVPIEAHYDCLEALEIAYEKYRCKKIAGALWAAFEEYVMNRQLGIAFEPNGTSYKWLKKIYLENVLHGRKLNGEPEDLNF